MRKPKHKYERLGKILRRHHKNTKYLTIHKHKGDRSTYRKNYTKITLKIPNHPYTSIEIIEQNNNEYTLKYVLLKQIEGIPFPKYHQTQHTNTQTILQELSKQGLQQTKAKYLSKQI